MGYKITGANFIFIQNKIIFVNQVYVNMLKL